MSKKKSITSQAFTIRYLRRSRELYRRYLETKPWINQLYTTFLGLKPSMTIVDVGCGTGDFTRFLAELIHGKCRIVGVDTRAASLKTAVSETRRARLIGKISYREGDAYNIPIENDFADLTCCRTLLMHLPDPVRAVKEMTRVTKIGGMVATVERGQLPSYYDPDDENFAHLIRKLGDSYVEGVRKLEGKDLVIGNRLPSILRKAGLSDIRAEIQADAWLLSDSRRKLEDVKAQLQFELMNLRENKKVDRKAMLAGGANGEQIDQFYRKYESKTRELLTDSEKLKHNTAFDVGGLYLVTGRKV